jgi:hypothetical protein
MTQTQSPLLKEYNKDAYFDTMGDLRAIVSKLKDCPDEMPIHTQVVGREYDSGAWMLYPLLELSPNFKSGPILTIYHPQLRRLHPEAVMVENQWTGPLLPPGNHKEEAYFGTIGKLRRLMEGLKECPDTMRVFVQVVGMEPNSGAWYMEATLGLYPHFKRGPILSIFHQNLLRLTPEVVFKDT